MAFDNRDIETPSPIISMDNFYAQNLGPKRKKICEILKTFSDDAEETYKAALYLFQQKDFPARQSLLSHCLVNLIDIINNYSENLLKKQLIEAISNVRFVVESNKTADEIKKVVQHTWNQGLKGLYDQKTQTKTLFMTKNPKFEKILQDENISPETKNKLEYEFGKKYTTIKNASNALNSCRHINEQYNTIPEQELCTHFTNIEEYLLELEDPSYIERKDILSDSLQKINAKTTTPEEPSEKEILFVFKLLKDNLKTYFLSKLENPSWFQTLFDGGMLEYSKEYNEELKDEIYSWDALPYLSKMASVIPEQVFDFMEPLINKINDVSIESPWLVKVIILSVAPEMPDKQFKAIMTAFTSYIYKTPFTDLFDFTTLKSNLIRFKRLDPAQALNLTEALLSLQIKSVGEYGSTEVVSKYGYNDYYRYQEMLKIFQEIYNKQKLKLFSVLVKIFDETIYKTCTQEEREKYDNSVYMDRPAIEDCEQNRNSSGPEHFAIDAMRDIALSIISTNKKDETNKVFDLLQTSKSPILVRLYLFLLSVTDVCDKKILSESLTNYEFFDGLNYHHEYFHLLNKKFKKLSKTAQSVILKYIEDGPTGDCYKNSEDNDFAKERQNRWKFKHLTPILGSLTKKQKEQFKDILFDDTGKPIIPGDHPDFLAWMSGFITVKHESPLKAEEIQKSSVAKIIKTMQEWQPAPDTWHGKPDREGFAEAIKQDVLNTPKKYISSLGKLTTITEPTYIRAILRGIIESGSKTSDDWVKIIDFIDWVAKQNETFDDRKSFHDGDQDWYWTKQEVASLLNSAFVKDSSIGKTDEQLIEKSFDILYSLINAEDKLLENKKGEVCSGDNYINRAINSIHGQALDSLLTFALWLKNNNKPIDQVEALLTDIVQHPKYIDSLAIIARALPWVHLSMPEFTEKNIDILFPESKEQQYILDVTWPTFVLYTHAYEDMFRLMKGKFFYVLKNHLYSDKDKKRTDKQIARHLILYYAWGLYDLDSEILSFLFDDMANKEEMVSFVNLIGFMLYQAKSNNDNVSDEILQRFIDFWEWFIEHIKGKESDYKDVLKEFERWYQCGKFTKGNWGLKHLHRLVADDNLKISMSNFMLEEILVTDLSENPRLVFDIVSRLAFRGARFDSFRRNGLIEQTLEYIKNHDFPEDETLKSEKDNFISKLLQNADSWELDDASTRFEKYREDR